MKKWCTDDVSVYYFVTLSVYLLCGDAGAAAGRFVLDRRRSSREQEGGLGPRGCHHRERGTLVCERLPCVLVFSSLAGRSASGTANAPRSFQRRPPTSCCIRRISLLAVGTL
jgi:hypothetical protein